MTAGAECVSEDESLQAAAEKMRDLDVGALPVCGEDERLVGMVTDRDIVVKCIAAGGDPASTTVGSLAGEGEVVTVGADDDVSVALETMKKYQVRRLPVIDGHTLVGMIAQADLAMQLPNDAVGEVVEEVSSPS
jgi:CBS domain-containing protein